MTGHLLLAQESDTGTKALIAIGVIVGGFVLGSLAGSIARRLASAESRPEAIRSSAAALATLAFSLILIVGLVIALGIVNREALDQLSTCLLYTSDAADE